MGALWSLQRYCLAPTPSKTGIPSHGAIWLNKHVPGSCQMNRLASRSCTASRTLAVEEPVSFGGPALCGIAASCVLAAHTSGTATASAPHTVVLVAVSKAALSVHRDGSPRAPGNKQSQLQRGLTLQFSRDSRRGLCRALDGVGNETHLKSAFWQPTSLPTNGTISQHTGDGDLALRVVCGATEPVSVSAPLCGVFPAR